METRLRFDVVRATSQRPLSSLLGPERPGHAEHTHSEFFHNAGKSYSGYRGNIAKGHQKSGHLNYLTACTGFEVIKCPNFHCKKWVGWKLAVA